MSIQILFAVVALFGLCTEVATEVTCGQAKTAYKQNGCCGNPSKQFISGATAFVTDVTKCINRMNEADALHENSIQSMIEYINSTYEYAADGHVIHPYVLAFQFPMGDLNDMTVDEFTAARNLIAHPFMPLGMQSKLTFEQGTPTYEAYATMLHAMQQDKDGHVFPWTSGFQSRESDESGGNHTNSNEIAKAYLGMTVQPQRILLSCPYHEMGELGPLSEFQ